MMIYYFWGVEENNPPIIPHSLKDRLPLVLIHLEICYDVCGKTLIRFILYPNKYIVKIFDYLR